MAAATGHKRSITWGSGSTPAWRVLIALKEKELPYESNLIEFSKGKLTGFVSSHLAQARGKTSSCSRTAWNPQ